MRQHRGKNGRQRITRNSGSSAGRPDGAHPMDIGFRAAQTEDFAFARSLYFETMRWIIERLFRWDQAR